MINSYHCHVTVVYFLLQGRGGWDESVDTFMCAQRESQPKMKQHDPTTLSYGERTVKGEGEINDLEGICAGMTRQA